MDQNKELLRQYQELLAQKRALEAERDKLEKELIQDLTKAAKDAFKIPEKPEEDNKN